MLNEDLRDIGTWSKAINIRRFAINDGFVFNDSLLIERNLFRDV